VPESFLLPLSPNQAENTHSNGKLDVQMDEPTFWQPFNANNVNAEQGT
jgi:hypothetical protein